MPRWPSLVLAYVLAACSTPGVDTARPDYSHVSYVFDLGICNTNDLVANTFDGTVTVLEQTGVGFLIGAGFAAQAESRRVYHHPDDPYVTLAVLAIGGSIGATFGAASGVVTAVEEVDLDTDRCMREQGYVLASEG